MIIGAAYYLFGIFTLIIATTYVLYPACLFFLGLLRRQLNNGPQDTQTLVKHVSIIVCAHNEEPVIKEKLRSISEQDWAGTYEVIIANDGSTDRTSEYAHSMRDDLQSLTVLEFDRNGKWSALNQAVDSAQGDILVFSDADTIWQTDALSELLSPFSSEKVGCVAGNIVSRKSQKSSAAGFDRIFRTYESTIRQSEEHLAGCISADGGLFAIRRELFQTVPPGVTDDFFISTGAVLQGKKIIFQKSSMAFENAITSEKKNLRRRIRITVRGLTSLMTRRTLLNPFKFGFYSVSLFFQKFLRRLSALLILGLFPLSIVLGFNHPFFALIAFGQAALYGSAILSLKTGISVPGMGKFSIAALHIMGLATGVVMFASGQRFDRWAPSRSK